jgi:RHS repeat-associated protein
LFQGQLWTQETGLNDYRSRVELPTIGVFLQPDPIGFKGDAANVYRLCNNNAVNRIDPTGLDWQSEGYTDVRDYSNIPNMYVSREWHPDGLGMTVQRLWLDAEPRQLADGKFTVEYRDVQIRSHSYIRNHYVEPYSHREWNRCPEQMQRTKEHEGRQQDIDKGYYDTHKDSIRKDVEGGTYKSYNAAKNAIARKEANWKQNLIDTRNAQGKQLQGRDGFAHESPDCEGSQHDAQGNPTLPRATSR